MPTDKERVNDVGLNIRIPRELRDAAQEKAARNAQSLSELIRRFLQTYVADTDTTKKEEE